MNEGRNEKASSSLLGIRAQVYRFSTNEAVCSTGTMVPCPQYLVLYRCKYCSVRYSQSTRRKSTVQYCSTVPAVVRCVLYVLPSIAVIPRTILYRLFLLLLLPNPRPLVIPKMNALRLSSRYAPRALGLTRNVKSTPSFSTLKGLIKDSNELPIFRVVCFKLAVETMTDGL